MRILLTGHLGYIGTAMTPMLMGRGYDVVGLDSDLYRACTFVDGIVQVPTIFKDIRDVEQADLEGFEAVLHLAGLSNDPLGDLNQELTYQINYKASVRLAELAKRAGARRFIFSSSCSNYGAGGDGMLTEESPFNPVTAYGRSKVLAEQGIAQLADDKFSPVFLRNATAYGLSPRLRFDLVLNNLVAWAFATGKVLLKSDGTPWRPIVHIRDIARAFITVLEAPRELIHNEAFNVARTDANYQIRELAEIAGRTVPDCHVEFAEGACPDKRCYRVNCDKIARTFSTFRPRWNARGGARQLYNAYKNNSFTLEEFEGPKYQRISHIRKLLKDGILDETLRFRRKLSLDKVGQYRAIFAQPVANKNFPT